LISLAATTRGPWRFHPQAVGERSNADDEDADVEGQRDLRDAPAELHCKRDAKDAPGVDRAERHLQEQARNGDSQAVQGSAC